jgi:hypothetical protein
MTEPTTKRCSICKTEQPIENFHKDSQKKDGRSSWCRPCTRDKETAYKAARAALAQSAASAPQTPTGAVSASEKPKRKPLTTEQKAKRNARRRAARVAD